MKGPIEKPISCHRKFVRGTFVQLNGLQGDRDLVHGRT